MRETPTSPTRLRPAAHQVPVLRLTWERPLAAWQVVWPRVAPALMGYDTATVRVALPLDLDDDASMEAFQVAAADIADADLGLDIVPRLGGQRAVNTATAARFHQRLLAALSSLPSSVGVFVFCEPEPRTLRAALSMGAGAGARARGIGGVVGGFAAALWSARQGHRDLLELARDLRARPAATTAAVPPPLVRLDSPLTSAAVHWLLGTPEAEIDDGPLFGPASALCCAPLVATDRQGQHRALSLWAARHREKSHAISVGPVSPLPGLEPGATYQAAAHLAQDLRAVTALGFSDITVMSVDGLVLDDDGAVRTDADAWIDAVVAGAANRQEAAA